MTSSWMKNGFKVPGTPESPCVRDETKLNTFNFSVLERIEDESPSQAHQVSMLQTEKEELKQKLAEAEKKLVEQERTIQLLQTQMVSLLLILIYLLSISPHHLYFSRPGLVLFAVYLDIYLL